MPRPILSAAAVLAAGAVLAGCAQTMKEEPVAGLEGGRQCLRPGLINGYSPAPDGPEGQDRFYIHTGARDRWLMESFGPCPELDWSSQLALDTRFSVGTLCAGDTASAIVPRGFSGPVNRCEVRLLGKAADR